MVENLEDIEVRSRVYEFLTIPILLDLDNPDVAQIKIPAGNFPAGFNDCEALTLEQLTSILQEIMKQKLAAGE